MKTIDLLEETNQHSDGRPLAGGAASARSSELRRLSRPIWVALLIGAISLLVLVTFLTRVLDRTAIDASEEIFAALIADRADHLSAIALEYSYWDEAVHNLVVDLNLDWIKDTLKNYGHEELGVQDLHLVDANNQSVLQISFSHIAATGDLEDQHGKSAIALVDAARALPKDTTPVPVTGIVGRSDGLYLASAIRLGTISGSDLSSDHVLVFAQAFHGQNLDALAGNYKLHNLSIQEHAPAFWQASAPIEAFSGEPIGFFVWSPALPGLRLLPFLTAGLLVIYCGMLIATRFFLLNANEFVTELENAKASADLANRRLADLARKDSLTELGNRRHFEEIFDKLSRAERLDGGVALLSIDLDGFKNINDTLGHEAGDTVLRHVANCLGDIVRSQDYVFRVGGDEFAILTNALPNDRAAELGNIIVGRLAEPFEVDGKTCTFGASVGIAFSCSCNDDLLSNADTALYSAKRSGKGRVAIFNESMEISDRRQRVRSLASTRR